MSTLIKNCARCGGEHTVVFKGFSKPILGDDDEVLFTHFALCPTNGEPILMLVINTPD